MPNLLVAMDEDDRTYLLSHIFAKGVSAELVTSDMPLRSGMC